MFVKNRGLAPRHEMMCRMWGANHSPPGLQANQLQERVREMAELSIATDTVFRLIEILHELAGQDRGLDREDSDEEGDDASSEALTREPDDARPEEVRSLVHDLNVDEQTDLVALMLLGRE